MGSESLGENLVAYVSSHIWELLSSIWIGLPWYIAIVTYLALLVGMIRLSMFLLVLMTKNVMSEIPLFLIGFFGISGGIISFFATFLGGYGLSSLGRLFPLESDFGNIFFVVITYIGILLTILFVIALAKSQSNKERLIALLCTLILSTICFSLGLLLSFLVVIGILVATAIYLPRLLLEAAANSTRGRKSNDEIVNVTYRDGKTGTARKTGTGIIGEKYYTDEENGRNFIN